MTAAGPSDEQLLAAAASVRHSRLLIRGQLDGVAVAVVDANGDGAVYECVVMRLHDDRWEECVSGSAGLRAVGWASGVAYAYGRSTGADVVQVGLHGELRRVPVDGNGWWLVLAGAEEHDGFDLSAVPAPIPTRRARGEGRPRIAG